MENKIQAYTHLIAALASCEFIAKEWLRDNIELPQDEDKFLRKSAFELSNFCAASQAGKLFFLRI